MDVAPSYNSLALGIKSPQDDRNATTVDDPDFIPTPRFQRCYANVPLVCDKQMALHLKKLVEARLYDEVSDFSLEALSLHAILVLSKGFFGLQLDVVPALPTIQPVPERGASN